MPAASPVERAALLSAELTGKVVDRVMFVAGGLEGSEVHIAFEGGAVLAVPMDPLRQQMPRLHWSLDSNVE